MSLSLSLYFSISLSIYSRLQLHLLYSSCDRHIDHLGRIEFCLLDSIQMTHDLQRLGEGANQFWIMSVWCLATASHLANKNITNEMPCDTHNSSNNNNNYNDNWNEKNSLNTFWPVHDYRVHSYSQFKYNSRTAGGDIRVEKLSCQLFCNRAQLPKSETRPKTKVEISAARGVESRAAFAHSRTKTSVADVGSCIWRHAPHFGHAA